MLYAVLYMKCSRDCSRSAIDGAAKEDIADGLYDSDDGLLESSEEDDDDDDDPDQKTQRMSEPRASASARPKAPPTPPSGNKSTLLYDTPVENNGPSAINSDGKSHIKTKAGVRPTVAFQMQEMEGRPSEDDQHDSSADGEANKQSDAGNGEGRTGGTVDFMREYMVSISVVDCTFPSCPVATSINGTPICFFWFPGTCLHSTSDRETSKEFRVAPVIYVVIDTMRACILELRFCLSSKPYSGQGDADYGVFSRHCCEWPHLPATCDLPTLPKR